MILHDQGAPLSSALLRCKVLVLTCGGATVEELCCPNTHKDSLPLANEKASSRSGLKGPTPR